MLERIVVSRLRVQSNTQSSVEKFAKLAYVSDVFRWFMESGGSDGCSVMRGKMMSSQSVPLESLGNHFGPCGDPWKCTPAWWARKATPLKNMSSSIGMMTFPTEWENSKNGHQTTNQTHWCGLVTTHSIYRNTCTICIHMCPFSMEIGRWNQCLSVLRSTVWSWLFFRYRPEVQTADHVARHRLFRDIGVETT